MLQQFNQNGGTQQKRKNTQQQFKIADVYQKMLNGDKHALSSLQKVKTHIDPSNHSHNSLARNSKVQYSDHTVSPRQFLHSDEEDNNMMMQFEKKTKKYSPNPDHPPVKSPQQSRKLKKYTFERLETITRYERKLIKKPREPQRPKQFAQTKESQLIALQNHARNDDLNNENDKNQKQFRSYIKKKVSELRNQKQVIKSRQIKELGDIGKNVKINMLTQSKSFDVMNKKDKLQLNPNQKDLKGSSSTIEHITSGTKFNPKMPIEQQSKFKKKVISASVGKGNVDGMLPPLKTKQNAKKLITENSDKNNKPSSIIGQSPRNRKEISTPIDLANSSIKIHPNRQLKAKSQVSPNVKGLHSKGKKPVNVNAKNEIPLPVKKMKQSLVKLSLPELKRQREEFAKINQDEKDAQFNLMQHHLQTKVTVERTKSRYELNFQNEEMLKEKKDEKTALGISTHKNGDSSATKIQDEEPKSIKKFDQMEIENSEKYKDISLIDSLLQDRKKLLNHHQKILNRNLFMSHWISHEIESEQSEDESEDISELPSSTNSQLRSAYSTVMNESKAKKWSLIKRKQYDTNRSFQEFAKSRSQVKNKSGFRTEQNNLSKIQQRQSQEVDIEGSDESNRIVVNSRLKNLLY